MRIDRIPTNFNFFPTGWGWEVGIRSPDGKCSPLFLIKKKKIALLRCRSCSTYFRKLPISRRDKSVGLFVTRHHPWTSPDSRQHAWKAWQHAWKRAFSVRWLSWLSSRVQYGGCFVERLIYLVQFKIGFHYKYGV